MAAQFKYSITEADKGQRLDHFLANKQEIGLSRSQISRLIEDNNIEVNNQAIKPSYRLRLEDRVSIKIPAPQKLEVKAENLPLDVVYEDSDLIVVNKSQGMVVHPAAGNYSGTLVNALLAHCKDLSGIGGILRPGIVHRLDKDTSGLIVVAKNDFTHQALAKQFKNKQIFKQYLALVHGEIKNKAGIIEAKVGRHPVHRKRMVVVKVTSGGVTKGRDAITHYKVLETFKKYSLIEVTLETGRTHQIRVHMTSMGYPIVGDPTYGHRKEEFKVTGQLLHSAKLGFIHPRTGKQMEFTKEMPDDMQAVLKELRARK
ncbi:MAG: RluA family pseudouridine synthase [Candidatus Margulisbacteria bacterium]|nr:RluA family pseudouridine synthase [Candidatus Margulisiibacteriota bacterium]